MSNVLLRFILPSTLVYYCHFICLKSLTMLEFREV